MKALAAESDSLSTIHGNHVVEGENPFPQLSSDIHVCAMVCTHMHTFAYTHTYVCT